MLFSIEIVAIAAKNKKPGERVYLPKEKKWATVQWIGKIENETVVDLVYVRIILPNITD